MTQSLLKLVLLSVLIVTAGCVSYAPMQTVSRVELDRFMGDWYVVASIPTFIEKNAFNPVENYRLQEDGSIATTFTFNKGALDGPVKKYHPVGYVKDTQSNALWGMQFIWPFKADYRIVYLDSNYQNTIISRQARDYVWIMSRSPQISDEQLARYKKIVAGLGYDVSKLQQPLHKIITKEASGEL